MHESFELDIGVLILQVHRLIVLATPILRSVRLIGKIRRWEASGLSLFILIVANLCALLPPAYYMTFLLGTFLLVGGLGVTHRRTQCLCKVFPPIYIKQEDLHNVDGPLSHQEMIRYYKAVLFKVNTVVQGSNRYLVGFYSVLKWEDIASSIRWFSSIVLMIVAVHLLPLRWCVVMLINLYILEGKIAHAIISQQANIVEARAARRKQVISIDSDTVSQVSFDTISTTSDVAVMQPSDSDSGNELDDDKDELSSEESDAEEAMEKVCDQADNISQADGLQSAPDPDSTSILQGKKGTRGPGVVGKLLEFKKKHQHAGNCVGCNVAFSSILKRRHMCTHCGNHFCSRCCSRKVFRSQLGATAPSAQTETVPVCSFCHLYLTGQKDAVTGQKDPAQRDKTS